MRPHKVAFFMVVKCYNTGMFDKTFFKFALGFMCIVIGSMIVIYITKQADSQTPTTLPVSN